LRISIEEKKSKQQKQDRQLVPSNKESDDIKGEKRKSFSHGAQSNKAF
jgi:hypothetical protein